MKKLRSILICTMIFSFMFFLISCGNNTQNDTISEASESTTDYSNENNSNNSNNSSSNGNLDEKKGSFSMTTERFDDSRSEVLILEKGEECNIHVTVKSTTGSVEVDVKDTNNDDVSYFEKENIKNEEFDIALDKAGSYVVTTDCNDHTGSFEVSWDITSK